MNRQERILAIAIEIGPQGAWGAFDKRFGSPPNQVAVRNMWLKIAERAVDACEKYPA